MWLVLVEETGGCLGQDTYLWCNNEGAKVDRRCGAFESWHFGVGYLLDIEVNLEIQGCPVSFPVMSRDMSISPYQIYRRPSPPSVVPRRR
jgi:hypothetical protein